MKALIQRVTRAQVQVNNVMIGSIDQGLLVLVGIDPADNTISVDRMAHRLLNYRVFSDELGRMNLNVQQIAGGLLLVPQFTLSADTRKGLRPSFTAAASPDQGLRVFTELIESVKNRYDRVASGQFGANMQLSLTNDGPVTFLLEH